MAKSKKAKKDNENKKICKFNLLETLIEEQKKGGGLITSMLSIKAPDGVWRGIPSVPPGSLIESIISEFDAKTDIPLEIPFFSMFHLIAGVLLHKGISVEFKYNGATLSALPDIWTVILAESGAGKTWTLTQLMKGIPDFDQYVFNMAGVDNTIAFIKCLEMHNKKLFVRDEFNEFYKAINKDSKYSGMRDVLLRLYDGKTVEHICRHEKNCIVVNNPAIVFLGTTVTKSFSDSINEDDLQNGLMQRINFIVAKKDPNKKMVDYPIYAVDSHAWNREFQRLIKKVKYQKYIPCDNAIDAYLQAFRLLVVRDLDESFFRRYIWTMHKYALIYHILLGNGNKRIIGPEAYAWAARIIALTLQDFTAILEQHGWSSLELTIQKVEALSARFEAQGKELTAREVVRHIRAVHNINEAKAILALIQNKTTELGGSNPSKGKLSPEVWHSIFSDIYSGCEED